ncbi:MAG: tRNA lysidine(34) synthetase TilS [Alphaproteobacteria bacterium]
MNPEAISAAEFARLMQQFAPFETAPYLGVAVSGGADSMALLWLATHWAKARGGTVLALHVDHGLRPASCQEYLVPQQLANSLGIRLLRLCWEGKKPQTGLQEKARKQRYLLLRKACRDEGVLHLLTAHHAGDQAETIHLRQASGSGDWGLAGMSTMRHWPECRLLRPLLAASKTSLQLLCRQEEITWLEDPSNHNPRFARARLRAELSATPSPPPPMLADARRIAEEKKLFALMASMVQLSPYGYAAIQAQHFASLDDSSRILLLQAIIRLVSGQPYAPSQKQLQKIKLGANIAGTWLKKHRDSLLLCREAPRKDKQHQPLILSHPTAMAYWDQRFQLRFHLHSDSYPLSISPLSQLTWDKETRKKFATHPLFDLPRFLWHGLPAAIDAHGTVILPHIGHSNGLFTGIEGFAAFFQPAEPLALSSFAIV